MCQGGHVIFLIPQYSRHMQERYCHAARMCREYACAKASPMGVPAHLSLDTAIRLLPGDRVLVLRSAVLGGGRLPLRRERPGLAVSNCQHITLPMSREAKEEMRKATSSLSARQDVFVRVHCSVVRASGVFARPEQSITAEGPPLWSVALHRTQCTGSPATPDSTALHVTRPTRAPGDLPVF